MLEVARIARTERIIDPSSVATLGLEGIFTDCPVDQTSLLSIDQYTQSKCVAEHEVFRMAASQIGQRKGGLKLNGGGKPRAPSASRRTLTTARRRIKASRP